MTEGLAEVDFQRMIYEVPELLEAFKGKKLEREVEAGGQFIDFVFVDGTYHNLVEMKYRQNPTNAINDLLKKAPKYGQKHSLPADRIVPIILVDEPTARENESELQFAEGRLGIRVLRYDPESIAQRYQALTKRKLLVGQTIDLPDPDRIQELSVDFERLTRQAPLLQIVKVIAGRGGYFQARREAASGGLGKLVVPLVTRNQTDDAIWLCFLRAATNSDEAATRIFEGGWNWSEIRTDFPGFEAYYAREYQHIRFRTSAGWEKKELPQTIKSFSSLVGESPTKFFRRFLEETGNFWDAHDRAYDAVRENVHKFGHWKAKNLFRHLEWYRVLPFQSNYLKPERGTYEGLKSLFGREFVEREAQQKVRELADTLGLSLMDVDLALWVIAGRQEAAEAESRTSEEPLEVLSALPVVDRISLRAFPDGLLAICSADPDKGLRFLVDHNAWGFPPIRRGPRYFALYISGDTKGIAAFARVASVEDPRASSNAAAAALKDHTGYRKGGRVIVFEPGSLRRIDPPIPLGRSRHIPQSFGYSTLHKFALAHSTDDLYDSKAQKP